MSYKILVISILSTDINIGVNIVSRLGGVRSQVQVLSSRLNNSKASKKLGGLCCLLNSDVFSDAFNLNDYQIIVSL